MECVQVEFRVRDVSQRASGGSYLVKYVCEVELTPGIGVTHLEVVNTVPENVDSELLRLTVEHIRRGADSVLSSAGLGARLKLRDLHIHDVDCKPYRFETPTAEGLSRLIAPNA